MVRRDTFLLAVWFSVVICTQCRGQSFADFTAPLPLPAGSTLVIGFLGGGGRWGDPHRGVRKVGVELPRIRGGYSGTGGSDGTIRIVACASWRSSSAVYEVSMRRR